MKTDPYLVPGQVCEVWHIDYKFREIRYFSRHVIVGDNTTRPVFVRDYNAIGINAFESCYDHYRPKCTEWDFAPGWALDPANKNVCSTVDRDGVLKFWSTTELYPAETGGQFYINEWHSPDDDMTNMLPCGICPDKSRYEGDAWKISLRMRPEWAEVG